MSITIKKKKQTNTQTLPLFTWVKASVDSLKVLVKFSRCWDVWFCGDCYWLCWFALLIKVLFCTWASSRRGPFARRTGRYGDLLSGRVKGKIEEQGEGENCWILNASLSHRDEITALWMMRYRMMSHFWCGIRQRGKILRTKCDRYVMWKWTGVMGNVLKVWPPPGCFMSK